MSETVSIDISLAPPQYEFLVRIAEERKPYATELAGTMV